MRLRAGSLHENCASSASALAYSRRVEVRHFAVACQDVQLEISQRVGLEGLQAIGSRLEFITDRIDAAEPLGVYVAVRQDLIERDVQRCRFGARDLGPEESREIGPQVGDRECVLGQGDGLLGSVESLGCAGERGSDLLQLRRRNNLKLALGVALQLLSDVDQRAVFPELRYRNVALERSFGENPHRLTHEESRIRHASDQEISRGLYGARRRLAFGRRPAPPSIVAFAQAIVLDEGTLETVSLNLLHAMRQNRRVKGCALTSRRGQDLSLADHLGLEEGGFVQEVKAVDVVAGHLDGQDVASLAAVVQGPFIDAPVAVGPAGRAVPHELPVEVHAVERRRRDAKNGRILPGALEDRPEPHKQVLFRLSVRDPHRLGRGERDRVAIRPRDRHQPGNRHRRHPTNRQGAAYPSGTHLHGLPLEYCHVTRLTGVFRQPCH